MGLNGLDIGGDSKVGEVGEEIKCVQRSGGEMEDERQRPSLEEEVDHIHAPELFPASMSAADILTHDFDGDYGTNFADILGTACNKISLGQLQTVVSCQDLGQPCAQECRKSKKMSKNRISAVPLRLFLAACSCHSPMDVL